MNFDRNVDLDKRFIPDEPLSLGRRSSGGKEFGSKGGGAPGARLPYFCTTTEFLKCFILSAFSFLPKVHKTKSKTDNRNQSRNEKDSKYTTMDAVVITNYSEAMYGASSSTIKIPDR